ncbi:IS110 family transposase [Spirosoma spitsbergense]|uniref:IS110 family transposase n=1 Tax=Spirosoma spitsbergense TaxID=431554 RepID=UPI0004780D16|nr:IS110 family transposase [Spirosoma spitsbergense]
METFTFFIGIDISKATLDWAVVMANKLLFHYQSSNDQRGIESFVKHLKQQYPAASFDNSLYCMEHTGIYNNHILSLLQVNKANVWVEHPIHIKESLGMIRGKNDKVDAQRIALYAYKNREEVHLWTPKQEVIQKLDRLTATRSRLVKVRKMLQSPLTDSDGFIFKKDHTEEKKSCQKTLDALTKDIKQIQADIADTIANDPYLKELYGYVQSVKGIGPAIATELLIITNEFKAITDPKKLACHAGVVPFVYSSGQYRGKAKTSNKANKPLKALLHNGAMSAIQHSQDLKAYYVRKTAEGKNEMLVINNVCNKLIHRVFACVHRREKYKDFYASAVA